MPANKVVYRVFISSPSDVAEERAVVLEVINQINQLRKANSSSIIEPLTWENDIVPKFGKKPQVQINEETAGKYDIFLGIMCSRFGTKTDNADSGTQEEFQIAYDQKLKTPQDIEVLFYFKDPRNSKTEIDAFQFVQVSKFKEELQKNDKYEGMYNSFKEVGDFRTKVMLHLNSILEGFEKNSSSSEVPNSEAAHEIEYPSDSSVADPLETLLTLVDEEELGVMEVIEELEQSSARLKDDLSTMTGIMQTLNENTNKRTQAANQLSLSKPVNPKDQRKLLDLIASDMNQFVEKSKGALPLLRDSLDENLELFRTIAVLANEDTSADEKDKQFLRENLQLLLDNMKQAQEAYVRFGGAVTKLPRLSTNVNRSKKNVAAIADGTSKMLQSAHEQLTYILESI